MPSAPFPLRRLLLPGLLALAVAACGGDADLDADPDDVDADAPASVTEEERAAFTAPEDGVLSEEQVEAYLKTSLLQFDLLRQESERLRGDVEEIRQRGEGEGGMLDALRNVAAAGRVGMQAVDLIGGSYVRSARALDRNPAEMEWVRGQIRDVGAHLTAQPIREMAKQGAASLREQAEQLRAQAEAGTLQGFTEEDVERMLESADEAERNAEESTRADPTVAANLEVMRRARSNVTDEMWQLLATWGSAEWTGIYGIGAGEDPEADRRIGQFRTLYEAALENRTLDDPAAAFSDG